jgi:beta-lactamase regulating signal transducer with metallopeptidase domain
MKSGAYSDTLFLVVTASLLPSIIPIAISQQMIFCSIGSNRNRTTTTKSVNAEETVRQASRDSTTNEDHLLNLK